MSTPTPTPGASPLVEQLPSNLTEIRIMPGFGNRLQIVFCGTEGMPEPMQGAVASVTVYGDGRIEYHPTTVEPAFVQCPVCFMHTNTGDHSHPEAGAA